MLDSLLPVKDLRDMSAGVGQGRQWNPGIRAQAPPGSSTTIGHLICQSKNPLGAEGGTWLSGNPQGSELRARGGNLSQRDHSRKPSAEKIEEVRCLPAEAPGRSDGPKEAGFLGVVRRRRSFYRRGKYRLSRFS